MTAPHTIRRAIEYLREARARQEAKRRPLSALYAVTRHVKRPCEAISLARDALVQHESLDGAIRALEYLS